MKAQRSTVTGKVKRATPSGKVQRAEADARCCCGPQQLVTWYGAWPCSGPQTDCSGDGVTRDNGKCRWITNAERCDLLKQAREDGLIPPECVTGGDECFVLLTGGSCAALDGTSLVCWENYSEACYILPLNSASCAFCVASTPSTDEPPGPRGQLVYLGTDCGDVGCEDPDNPGGGPKPPHDPGGDPATVDGRCDCPDGSDHVVVTLAVGMCRCSIWEFGGTHGTKIDGDASGTYDLPEITPGACSFGKTFKWSYTKYDAADCSGDPGLHEVVSIPMSAAYTVGVGWDVEYHSSADGGPDFFHTLTPGGTACNATLANNQVICGHDDIRLQEGNAAVGGAATVHYRTA